MLDLYVAGHSPLHRLSAGPKILALALAGSLLFLLDSPWISAAGCLFALLLYRLAGLSMGRAWAQIRPALWVLGLIFLAQAFFVTWQGGLHVVARLCALLMLAGLLTLTTRASAMLEAIEAALAPLSRIGLDTARVGLAISLCLRFIPVLVRVVEEVREAQKVRGREGNVFALVLPVLIRMIKMSEDIADAIDARGF